MDVNLEQKKHKKTKKINYMLAMEFLEQRLGMKATPGCTNEFANYIDRFEKKYDRQINQWEEND